MRTLTLLALLYPLPHVHAQECMPAWQPTFGADLDGTVACLEVLDGSHLIAGGDFLHAGGLEVNGIAAWDGSAWTGLGSGMDGGVAALALFDEGSGPALVAGGGFQSAGGVAASNIARWDGNGWTSVGGGIDGLVHTLEVLDVGQGPRLYAGGWFTSAGGVSTPSIACWDGVAWQPVGEGLFGYGVHSLAVFDGGNGPELHAGGFLSPPGGVGLFNIARFDGEDWHPLGGGTTGTVHAMEVFDDGTGPALYLGAGWSAGGVEVRHIARWDGSSWSPLGRGLGGPVRSLHVFDDGSGEALYAGGLFDRIDGVRASQIARWDGVSWSALDRGTVGPLYSSVLTMATLGESLLCGGDFSMAPDSGDAHLARWSCETGSPVAYCHPHGPNSISPEGARLVATGGFGSASASFDLIGVPSYPGMLYAGTGSTLVPFACSSRCVGGDVVRGSVIVPVSGQASGVSLDMSHGGVAYVQYVYRDSQLPSCGPGTRYSNALGPR